MKKLNHPLTCLMELYLSWQANKMNCYYYTWLLRPHPKGQLMVFEPAIQKKPRLVDILLLNSPTSLYNSRFKIKIIYLHNYSQSY